MFLTWGVKLHRYFYFQTFYWSCMFLEHISFWTANIISGHREVCSHWIRPCLPLSISEKNEGGARKIASFVQSIFRNQNVYSSLVSSKWESYKSNAFSERCFTKKLFCKILNWKIAVVKMLKTCLWKNKIKFWLKELWNIYCWPYTTNCFSSGYKWCEPITINTQNCFCDFDYSLKYLSLLNVAVFQEIGLLCQCYQIIYQRLNHSGVLI